MGNGPKASHHVAEDGIWRLGRGTESTIFVLKFDAVVNTDIYRPLWRLVWVNSMLMENGDTGNHMELPGCRQWLFSHPCLRTSSSASSWHFDHSWTPHSGKKGSSCYRYSSLHTFQEGGSYRFFWRHLAPLEWELLFQYWNYHP